MNKCTVYELFIRRDNYRTESICFYIIIVEGCIYLYWKIQIVPRLIIFHVFLVKVQGCTFYTLGFGG